MGGKTIKVVWLILIVADFRNSNLTRRTHIIDKLQIIRYCQSLQEMNYVTKDAVYVMCADYPV